MKGPFRFSPTRAVVISFHQTPQVRQDQAAETRSGGDRVEPREGHGPEGPSIKLPRSAKTKQLKREVEVIAQNHERDMDRKDAIMQMLDRDLDEAEEQHQVAIRTHLLNVDTLMELQKIRLEALDQNFRDEVRQVEDQWALERTEITDSAQRQIRELQHVLSVGGGGPRSEEGGGC